MWGAVGEVKKNKQAVAGLVFLVRGTADSGPPIACSFVRRGGGKSSKLNFIWSSPDLKGREGGVRRGRLRVDGRLCGAALLRRTGCQINTIIPFPEVGSLIGGIQRS